MHFTELLYQQEQVYTAPIILQKSALMGNVVTIPGCCETSSWGVCATFHCRLDIWSLDTPCSIKLLHHHRLHIHLRKQENSYLLYNTWDPSQLKSLPTSFRNLMSACCQNPPTSICMKPTTKVTKGHTFHQYLE